VLTRIMLSAAATLWAVAFAAPTSAAEPPPIRVGGVGLNVSDVERSLKFYTEALGLKVAFRLPAQGPIQEVALCVSGDIASGEPFVVLTANSEPLKPGGAQFGRVIINTPDAAAVAARAARLGYSAVKMGGAGASGARPVYFLTDPDGYAVELYQASTAEAKY
jgi:lactoylglutathione lyase